MHLHFKKLILTSLVIFSSIFLFSFFAPNIANAAAPTGTSATLKNSTATTVDIEITGTDFFTFVNSASSTTTNATDLANISYTTTSHVTKHPISATINTSTSLTATFDIVLGTGKSGDDFTIAADTIQDGSSNHNVLITIADANITDTAKPVLKSVQLTGGSSNVIALSYSEPVTIPQGSSGNSTPSSGDIITAGTIAGFGSFATHGNVTVPTGKNNVQLAFSSVVEFNLAGVTGGYFNSDSSQEPAGVFTPIASTSLEDTSGNQVNTAVTPTLTGNGNWNLIKPTVTSISVADQNSDGKIDAAQVIFNKDMRVVNITVTDAHLGIATNAVTMTVQSLTQFLFLRSTYDNGVDTSAAGGNFTYTGTTTLLTDSYGNLLNTTTPGTIASGDVTEIDLAPPIVKGSNPSAGSTGQSLTNDIIVSFSEPIAPSSLDFSSSPSLSYTPTWSEGNKVLNLSHSAFAASTTYTVTVGTGTTDAASPANAMSAQHQWSFTTGVIAPPTGSSARLTDSTETTVDLMVTGDNFVTFIGSNTKTALPADLAKITYRSTHPTSAIINNSTTLTLTFPISIGTDKSGSLTIDAGTVQDVSLDPNVLITIVDGNIVDNAVPVMLSVSPGSNATNIGVDTPIVMTFSEALNQTTFNNSSILFRNSDSQGVTCTNSWVGNQVTCNHATLLPSTYYRIRVSSSNKDLAASPNYLAVVISYFTTGSAPSASSATLQNSTATSVDIVVTGANFSTFVGSGTTTAGAGDLANILYNSTNPTSATIDNSTTITARFPISAGTGKSGGSLTIAADTIQDGSSTHNALITITNGSITDNAKPVLKSVQLVGGSSNVLALRYSETVVVPQGSAGASTSSSGDITSAGTVAGFGSFANPNTGNVTVPTTGNAVQNLGGTIIQVWIASGSSGADYMNATSSNEPSGVFTPIASTSLEDTSGNQVNTAVTPTLTGNGNWNLIKPNISSITVSDPNHDGRISRAVLLFDKNMHSISFTNADARLGTTGTTTGTFGGLNNNTITFDRIVDDNAVDTSTTGTAGDFTYTGATTLLRDTYGNLLNTTTPGTIVTADIAETDGATPVVTSVSPSNGSTGVSNVTDVVVNFSESIHCGTFAGLSGVPALPAGSFNCGNGVYTIHYTNLQFNTTYNITVAATTTRDIASVPNYMAADYTWGFTTISSGSAPILSQPTIVSASTVKASSAVKVIGAFSVTEGGGISDTIDQFTIENKAALTAVTADIASVAIYSDTGTLGIIDGSDAVACAQSTTNTTTNFDAGGSVINFTCSSPIAIGANATKNYLAVVTTTGGATNGRTMAAKVNAHLVTAAAWAASDLSTTNSITIDTVAPQVSTVAVATGLTVDITFDSAMGSGVTTATNYIVSGTGKGSLSNNPNSAALVSGNQYVLTWTSGEMFNGGNITITVANAQDLAGNVIDGAYNAATASGTAIGTAPTYSVTSVSPVSGNTAKVGDSVVVSVTAGGSETGLTASGTQSVNGVTSVFSEVGAGVYHITYIVVEGNNDIADSASLPVSITLKDAAGNIGTTISTIASGTAPGIDAHKPIISAVAITAGTYKIGSVIPITLTADAGGYSAGAITINSRALGSFTDATGGVYTGTYTVMSGDTDRASVGVIPISVVLIDAALNSSVAYTTAPTSGGTVTIDANAPSIPIFSPAGGTYVGTQSINISSTGSDSIRYTIDGATPSCSVGTLYSGAISVTESETINAIGCDVVGNTPASSVASYTINMSARGGGGGLLIIPPVVNTVVNTAPHVIEGCTTNTGFSGVTGESCTNAIIAPVSTPNTSDANDNPTTTTTATGPFIRPVVYWERSNEVKKLQNFLKDQGYFAGTVDGIFGPNLYTALKKFQAANGINMTGSVGPLTFNKLNEIAGNTSDVQTATTTPKKIVKITMTTTGTVSTPGNISKGVDLSSMTTSGPFTKVVLYLERGDDVQKIQQFLHDQGYFPGTPDGLFGPTTYTAIRKFQIANGIRVTGAIGSLTLDKMNELSQQQ